VRSVASYIVIALCPLLSAKPASPEAIIAESCSPVRNRIATSLQVRQAHPTALLILGEQIMSHVGDSRAYFIDPNGEMEALTRDHSLVRRLEELGQITHEEAAVHPQRNVLYRALGQGEPFDPDVKTMRAPGGGLLLICSDGLWGVISEDEIKKIVIGTLPLDQACQALVDAANAAGGPDNITAILVRLPG
jgi:protein phosphatase